MASDIAAGLLLGGTLVGFGLFPLRLQNRKLAGPDPALRRALAAASLGFWRPAAELLAEAGERTGSGVPSTPNVCPASPG